MIIDRAKVRPRWSRARDVGLTMLMWLAYAVLMVPTALFFYELALLLGHARDWPENLPRPAAVLDTMLSYGAVILFNGGVFVAWARYNLIRFRGKERRKAVPPIGLDDLARFHQRKPEEIARWQRSRIVRVHYGDSGGLAEVEVLAGPTLPEKPA